MRCPIRHLQVIRYFRLAGWLAEWVDWEFFCCLASLGGHDQFPVGYTLLGGKYFKSVGFFEPDKVMPAC